MLWRLSFWRRLYNEIGLKYPTIPTKSGYVFTGWYTESSCINLYDFTEDLTKDITLYAGWTTASNSGYSTKVINASDYTSSSDYYYTSISSSSSSSSPYYIYTSFLTGGTKTFYYSNQNSSSSYTVD